MYGILHHIVTNALEIRAGWVHLPHLPEVAALPENLGVPSDLAAYQEELPAFIHPAG